MSCDQVIPSQCSIVLAHWTNKTHSLLLYFGQLTDCWDWTRRTQLCLLDFSATFFYEYTVVQMQELFCLNLDSIYVFVFSTFYVRKSINYISTLYIITWLNNTVSLPDSPIATLGPLACSCDAPSLLQLHKRTQRAFNWLQCITIGGGIWRSGKHRIRPCRWQLKAMWASIPIG